MRPINRKRPIAEVSEGYTYTIKKKRTPLAKTKIELSLEAKKERIQFLRTKEFVKSFIKNKKREYSHELWLSVKHSSLLFPPNQLKEAERRLRGLGGKTFEQKILERVIILPTNKYLELEKVLKLSGSQGLFFKGLAFVSESALKRKGVVPSVAHEVSHLIDFFAGVYRDQKGLEAMGEARALFSASLMSQKIRQKALNQALREFKSKTNSKEYVEGINLGRAIFLLADFIRRENGVGEAEKFVCEVAKNNELNDGLVRVLYKRAIDGF